MKKGFVIHITSGDQDGIGIEITLKALALIQLPKNFTINVYSSRTLSALERKLLRSPQIKRISNQIQLLIFEHKSPAVTFAEVAAQVADNPQQHALVTGPMSKQVIHQSYHNCLGHTDILQKVLGFKNLHMGFVGAKFIVTLVTGHLPVSKIERQLNSDRIERAILLHRLLVPDATLRKPIGVLGLNPHSGDGGLIGTFEQLILAPALKRIHRKGLPAQGPLIPDVAFQKQNWRKYSGYVALYHDQGLIPFKMAHGLAGVHVTLGLPFLRASVDHGTAKDIFGMGLADASSMVQSLQWTIQQMKRSQTCFNL